MTFYSPPLWSRSNNRSGGAYAVSNLWMTDLDICNAGSAPAPAGGPEACPTTRKIAPRWLWPWFFQMYRSLCAS